MVGIKTNIFLSDGDLENVARWKYKVDDKSMFTMLLTPIWNFLARMIPVNVAPNVLTLAAFGCVLQAFWLVHEHGEEFPRVSAIGAGILTYLYFTLDAIDGVHARNIKNTSPLGELFDHGCDNLGTSFQVITLLKILGWDNPYTYWYLVQAAQLVFLSHHVAAYSSPDKTIRFGLLSGPGEVLHVMVGTMFLHAIVGKRFMWDLFVTMLRLGDRYLIDLGLPDLPDIWSRDGVLNAEAFLAKGSQLLYYGVVVGLVTQLIRMTMSRKEDLRRSGKALLLC